MKESFMESGFSGVMMAHKSPLFIVSFSSLSSSSSSRKLANDVVLFGCRSRFNTRSAFDSYPITSDVLYETYVPL